MNKRQAEGRIHSSQIFGGIIVAVCGLALYWLLASLQEAVHPILGDVGATVTALGVLALVGVVGAYLLRSWWAILVVPTCFLVFWYLGSVIDALQPGRLYRPWELSGLGGMLGIFALFILPPLLVGAAIGATISQRVQHQRASS